jgi:cytochrome bd-type quinol oxidase subunit 1
MNSKKVLLIVLLFIIVGLIAGLLNVSYLAKKQPNRGVAMEDLLELYRPELKPLGTVVIKTYREFRGNTVRWSAAYFGCLFGSAFFSAMAGLLLKLEILGTRPKLRNDLAASLATLAALLVTLSTTGDFQRKWQANRVAAAAMENLAYELIRPQAATHLDVILTRIQNISDTRHRAIVGEIEEGGSQEPLPLPEPAQSKNSAEALQ